MLWKKKKKKKNGIKVVFFFEKNRHKYFIDVEYVDEFTKLIKYSDTNIIGCDWTCELPIDKFRCIEYHAVHWPLMDSNGVDVYVLKRSKIERWWWYKGRVRIQKTVTKIRAFFME